METVTVDTSSLDRILNHYTSQFPYAVARGLTKLAQAAQKAEKDAIRQVFDRPTPFTVNSPVIRPATKETLTSRVFIRDEATKGTPPSKYLRPEVFGGARSQKRTEVGLSSYLGKRVWVVPASGKMDQYGNVRGSEMQKVLASLGLNPMAKAGFDKRGRTLKERGIVYFVGRPGGGRLPYGVWVRTREPATGIFRETGVRVTWKLEPILFIVAKPTYKKLFPFFAVATKAVSESMWRVMMDAEDEAIRTAR